MNTLYVKGLPWCKDEEKQVGLGSLTARVLCVHHNNALADTDAEMKRLSDAFREVGKLTLERIDQMPPWPLVNFQMNGPLLERWFLKTALSIYLQNASSIPWAFSVNEGHLPEYLVQAAFARTRVINPVGLYRMFRIGEIGHPDEVFTCEWLHDHEKRIAGAAISWQRIRFLLWLSPRPTGEIMQLQLKTCEQEEHSTRYHPETIRWIFREVVSHTVDFTWT